MCFFHWCWFIQFRTLQLKLRTWMWQSFVHLIIYACWSWVSHSWHRYKVKVHDLTSKSLFLCGKSSPEYQKKIRFSKYEVLLFPRSPWFSLDFQDKELGTWNMKNIKESHFQIPCEMWDTVILHLPHDTRNASQNCVLDDANVKLMTVTCRLPPPSF